MIGPCHGRAASWPRVGRSSSLPGPPPLPCQIDEGEMCWAIASVSLDVSCVALGALFVPNPISLVSVEGILSETSQFIIEWAPGAVGEHDAFGVGACGDSAGESGLFSSYAIVCGTNDALCVVHRVAQVKWRGKRAKFASCGRRPSCSLTRVGNRGTTNDGGQIDDLTVPFKAILPSYHTRRWMLNCHASPATR